MDTLPDGRNDIYVDTLKTLAEVDGFIALLESIAIGLSWQPGDHIRAYQDVAQHLAVRVGDVVAGGLQAVPLNDTSLLPHQNVWPEVAEEPASLHVTILAMRPEYRGRRDLFSRLCVELWRFCVAVGIVTVLLEATPATLKVYRRLGWPLEVIGELRPHWGEDCYLCRVGVSEAATALTAKAPSSPVCREMVGLAFGETSSVTAGADA